MPRRFHTIPEVAESLATSEHQIRAPLRNGDLEGSQIGGRGQWRIEDAKLDEHIGGMYQEQRESRSK